MNVGLVSLVYDTAVQCLVVLVVMCFHRLGPLGRVGHRVAMSVCLFVCDIASPVTYHLSHIMCLMIYSIIFSSSFLQFNFFFNFDFNLKKWDKVVELVGGRSVINAFFNV